MCSQFLLKNLQQKKQNCLGLTKDYKDSDEFIRT